MGSVFYQTVDNEVDIFKAASEMNLPVLLKGPTGCGKSRFVEYMADQAGKKLITVVCNDETSATDLLGRYLIQGSETVWQDGPVTTAVKEGTLLYLDEIAEAREDIITVLHSLSDHRRELYLDRRNEFISADPGFMMVVSFNPGYQKSLKEMKPSTRQRFVSIPFDYPSKELEISIVETESNLERRQCEKLVGLAEKIRRLDELGLAETVSTRLLIGAAKLIKNGLKPRLACEVGVIQSLSDDKEVIDGLNDLTSLHF